MTIHLSCPSIVILVSRLLPSGCWRPLSTCWREKQQAQLYLCLNTRVCGLEPYHKVLMLVLQKLKHCCQNAVRSTLSSRRSEIHHKRLVVPAVCVVGLPLAVGLLAYALRVLNILFCILLVSRYVVFSTFPLI
jgi:hypothetical protein